VDRRTSNGLRVELSADPEAARAAFRRALDLREALYRVLSALARDKPPAPADLESLNRHVRAVYSGATLVASSGGFTPWRDERGREDRRAA
jgi:predicted RNA-binding Zn ribbon-like protein